MPPEEFIGLDIGERRIGVARGSSAAKIAEPLVVLSTGSEIDALQKLINQHNPGGIVVGLPRNLRGEETAQTAKVRAWVNQAKKSLKPTFYWQDEALTSHEATTNRGAQKNDVDAAAAAIILQDFLDSTESNRTVC